MKIEVKKDKDAEWVTLKSLMESDDFSKIKYTVWEFKNMHGTLGLINKAGNSGDKSYNTFGIRYLCHEGWDKVTSMIKKGAMVRPFQGSVTLSN